MKILTTILSISLMLFSLCVGCSKEEPPPPPPKKIQKIKIVKPIKKPEPEKAPLPAEQERERAKAQEAEKIKTAVVEGKPKQVPETVTEEKEIQAKEGEDVKTAAVEEKALKMPETDERKKETAVEEVTGYYIVKEGDSLSGIAAGEDVYEDSLKWPILYRLNMDKLGKLQLGKGFPDRELPEGVRLKISTPDEIKENLERRPHNVWVVNVLSATTSGEIIPAAIRLINNGYLVFITRAKVKGKDWMRLRVGFFKDRAESDTEAKKIMTMLNLVNSWVSKIGEEEFAEFGGY